MAEEQVRYYILFANYEQGSPSTICWIRREFPTGLPPAPRAIQGELSCGMSLLIQPEALEATRDCIRRHHAPHHAIVPLAGQIKPRRDRYC